MDTVEISANRKMVKDPWGGNTNPSSEASTPTGKKRRTSTDEFQSVIDPNSPTPSAKKVRSQKAINNMSTPKYMPPDENDYEGAIAYNQRFTHRQWNLLLLLLPWDFTGGVFPRPGHLEGYCDRTNIVNSSLPWTVWGDVMIRHMATANAELRRIMPILGSTARTNLQHEGNVFGARFMYWQLKRLWTEDRSHWASLTKK